MHTCCTVIKKYVAYSVEMFVRGWEIMLGMHTDAMSFVVCVFFNIYIYIGTVRDNGSQHILR